MFCVVFCATRTPNFCHVLLMLHACMYVCNATKLLNLFLCCLSLNVGIVFLLSKLKVLPAHVHRSSPMAWGALLWTRQKLLIGYSLSLEGHYWTVCNTYPTTPEFWIWNLLASCYHCLLLKLISWNTVLLLQFHLLIFWIFISVVRDWFPSFLFSSDLITGFLILLTFGSSDMHNRSTISMDRWSWPFPQIPFFFHFGCLRSVSFLRVHDEFGFSLFLSDKSISMDRRSWPWKKKSSERSSNTDSSQSSNQAEQVFATLCLIVILES